MSRHLVRDNIGVKVYGEHEQRIGHAEKRVDGEWIHVGTYPTDADTTPDSPVFKNGHSAQNRATWPVRFRWKLDGGVEFDNLGKVTGGADNTVIFTLPADRYKPDFDYHVVASNADCTTCVFLVRTNGDVSRCGCVEGVGGVASLSALLAQAFIWYGLGDSDANIVHDYGTSGSDGTQVVPGVDKTIEGSGGHGLNKGTKIALPWEADPGAWRGGTVDGEVHSPLSSLSENWKHVTTATLQFDTKKNWSLCVRFKRTADTWWKQLGPGSEERFADSFVLGTANIEGAGQGMVLGILGDTTRVPGWYKGVVAPDVYSPVLTWFFRGPSGEVGRITTPASTGESIVVITHKNKDSGAGLVGEIRMYVNSSVAKGLLSYSIGAASNTTFTRISSVRWGSGGTANNASFPGSIDEFLWWNKALSASEVGLLVKGGPS